jgi:hypothetical protein
MFVHRSCRVGLCHGAAVVTTGVIIGLLPDSFRDSLFVLVD